MLAVYAGHGGHGGFEHHGPFVYQEGTIFNAGFKDYKSMRKSIWWKKEMEADIQSFCDVNKECVGYWQHINGKYYPLRKDIGEGSKNTWTWRKHSPNLTVKSVKKVDPRMIANHMEIANANDDVGVAPPGPPNDNDDAPEVAPRNANDDDVGVAPPGPGNGNDDAWSLG